MSATASTLPGNLIQGYRSSVGADQVVLGKESLGNSDNFNGSEVLFQNLLLFLNHFLR